MKLSELQEKIVTAPEPKIIVMSASASGKTRVMTERVRFLLHEGIDPNEIAVITFTNMAAEELRQRLGNDYTKGLFVGTIHALANYMLLSHGVSTKEILDDEEFDKLFKLVKENPQCVRHYEWVLLDEAQDTDKLQFQFILDMIHPEHFFFAGDPRQSIYRFRNARPDLLIKLAHSKDVKCYSLYENYRNGSEILSYAKTLIKTDGIPDNSISRSGQNGRVIHMLYDEDDLATAILAKDDYKDWAILTRTNQQVYTITKALSKHKIPYETFKQSELGKEGLSKRMAANTVKVLTVHSAKGLEWKNVIVISMLYYSPEERSICYVAATRAKEMLYWIRSLKPKTKKF